MQRKIITTADGSKTIHITEWNEQYHSVHGALQEAKHVFIKTGLLHVLSSHLKLDAESKNKKLSILEIGFGTGLNAYLSLLEAKKQDLLIDYVGVEAYPVSQEEIKMLNYPKILAQQNQDELFDAMHKVSWEEMHQITNIFSLTKRQQFFKDIDDIDAFNLIYFDAFGARVQPDLWTESIFKKMFIALKPNGVLVTYSAKGSVRRAMQEVGFSVERLSGPPGKREMLRASKKG